MKRVISSLMIVGLFLVLAVVVSAMGTQETADTWVWGPPVPLSQVFNYDEQNAVIEGKITGPAPGWPSEWKIYLFSDGTEPGPFRVNFEDTLPAAAIPMNVTVRIFGEAEDGELDVEGLQVMQKTSIQATGGAAGIDAGAYNDRYVWVNGTIGEKDPSEPAPGWNWYKFSDSSGTATLDLQDPFTDSDVPKDRTVLIWGKGNRNIGKNKLNVEYIFVTLLGDAPPPATPTTAPPTATLPPNVTPPPTNTPVPGGESFVYLPVIMSVSEEPPPTATPPGPTVTPEPPSGWVWEKTNTIAQINGRCCDDQIVVVEGKIGQKIVGGGVQDSWNYYEFDDGTGKIPLDFEDEVPAAAIPRNVTVRVLGEPGENNNIHKIEVDAVQTLGSVPVQTNATAAGINNGSFKDADVALIGRFGKLIDQWFLWFEFMDNTGTTVSDIGNNNISPNQIPRDRDVWIFGEGGEDFGVNKVDTDYFLIATSYK